MNKHAFTLAEVLITLGIIGVVAALTLPSLISNHRKNVTLTRLKKVYSVMNQAIAQSIAENGDYTDWVKDCGLSHIPTCTPAEAQDWFMEYLGRNLKILKTVPQDSGFFVYFVDGGILVVTVYLYDMGFYIDEQAVNSPQTGKNYFNFRFMPNPIGNNIDINANRKGFEPYTFESWEGSREGLIHAATNDFGCSETESKAYCTKLIQWEGWTIPDDYPFKF
jgi:prepilin-type N-terminal cleavage/methylation domain-containing protein